MDNREQLPLGRSFSSLFFYKAGLVHFHVCLGEGIAIDDVHVLDAGVNMVSNGVCRFGI